MTNPQPKYWTGTVENCDICHKPITKTFVDGSTRYGPWATMCSQCFHTVGKGLGTGKGQMYQKQANGSWLKIRG